MTEPGPEAGEVLPLRLLASSDRRAFGGKAAVLGEMIRRGLPVLPGIAVAADAYRSVVGSSGARRLVERFWDTPADDSESLETLSREIQRLLANSDIRPLAHVTLATLETERVEGPLLVRSSATGEDGSERSFAGQFMSVLAEDSPEILAEAIADVWGSATGRHVPAYLRSRIGRLPTIAMGLAIQPYRCFELAGIAFSQHPTVPLRNWALVELLDAPPDQIVSGEVTPHRMRLSLADGRMLYEHRGQGDAQLSSEQAMELARLLALTRDLLEAEVDVEWGILDGTVVLLQARPDTIHRRQR